ncbi:MAG: hypothetical protein Q4D85_07050 [Corynebacterium sp.]|uniref:hypothetical protein n=1 Tax=Corynebacterium sp. TaxID=1720 RepID=UPI0026DB5FAF|nr:hypothetical protein [Corynebacterium sp.]MDO5098503.1 hypothetical protein [Corynebacterium sp.]
MSTSSRIQQAVEILYELGWLGSQSTPEKLRVSELELGTPAQQETVVEALSNPRWPQKLSHYLKIPEREIYGRAETTFLQFFAIRAGAQAQDVDKWPTVSDEETLAELVEKRGEKFVCDFLRLVNYERTVDELQYPTRYAVASVLLVHSGATIPDNPTYLNNWALTVLPLIAPDAVKDFPVAAHLAITKKNALARLPEHIACGVKYPVLVWGAWGKLLVEAEKHAMVDRGVALDAVVRALDVAQKRSQIKRCMSLLVDDLAITDEELLARTDVLVPLLARGDSLCVTSFAPRLIAAVPSDGLAEVALAASYVSTMTGQRKVFQALVKRGELPPQLRDRVEECAGSPDTQLAGYARKLLGGGTSRPDTTEYFPWLPTPSLWEVPACELGEVTVDSVAETFRVADADEDCVDISRERFLALLVQLAAQDVEQARRAVAGGTRTRVGRWSKNRLERWGRASRTESLPVVRELAVLPQLGRVPCLLSQPSRVDLSITFPDLRARLALYDAQGVAVLEPDLVLALTRLDPATIPPKPQVECSCPILLDTGAKHGKTAGQVVEAYCLDPFVEPDLAQPTSLAGFPVRLHTLAPIPYGVFPHWSPDIFLTPSGSALSHRAAQQLACSGVPLGPRASMAVLVSSPDAARVAWSRGLLRPGVPDPAACPRPRGLAQSLSELAREGLLALVWPLFDAVIGVSLNAKGSPRDLVDIVHAMSTFAPSVIRAVKEKSAPESACELPYLRQLAARPGKSAAKQQAGALVALLPEVHHEPEAQGTVDYQDFSHLWARDSFSAPACSDGVEVTVTPSGDCVLTLGEKRFLAEDPRAFFANSSYFMWKVRDDSSHTVWLAWRDGAMVVADKPKFVRPDPGSIVPTSIVACLVVGLGTKDTYEDASRVFDKMLSGNHLSTASIDEAMAKIVGFCDYWNPTVLLRLVKAKREQSALLWPILSHLLTYAAQACHQPKWLNGVLGIMREDAGFFRWALVHQRIPADRFAALARLGQDSSNATATVRRKAKELSHLLNLAKDAPA